jgi:hypothetical protein
MDKRHHVGERNAASGSRAGSQARPGLQQIDSQPTVPQQKVIDQDRAAALLGVTTEELRRLSSETGLGRAEHEQGREQVVFTYAELYRLCRSAVQVAD